MKKVLFSGLMVVLLLAVSGCKDASNNTETDVIVNNPSTGEMTEETGRAIFDYSESSAGITINKFLSNEALEAYLNTSRAADGANIFVIGRINGIAVVRIGINAFTPDSDENDISAIINAIELPPTIDKISPDAFVNLDTDFIIYVPESLNEKLHLDETLEGKTKVETIPDPIKNDDDTNGNNTPPDPTLTYDHRLLGRWEAEITNTYTDDNGEEYSVSFTEILSFSETILSVSRIPSTDGSSGSVSYEVKNNIIYIDHDNDGKIDNLFLSYEILNENSVIFTVLDTSDRITFTKK
jgi:hypothetical protein